MKFRNVMKKVSILLMIIMVSVVIFDIDTYATQADAQETLNDAQTNNGSIPSRFNLRDHIEIETKNQANDDCWAHATTTAMETHLALVYGETVKFSNRHMDYATTRTFADGLNNTGFYWETSGGGSALRGMGYATGTVGPVLESTMPYERNLKVMNLADIDVEKSDWTVSGYRMYPSKTLADKQSEDIHEFRNMIKEHIMNYGSLYTFMHDPYDNMGAYMNVDTFGYYYDGTTVGGSNHAISIIGWDDDYPVENFKAGRRPSKPGAYIVLNSWGKSWQVNFRPVSDDGVFYISYEDIQIEKNIAGIVSMDNSSYDKAYQYTNGLVDSFWNNSSATAMIYERDINDTEYLNSVAIGLNETDAYEIYLNQNGEVSFDGAELIASGSTSPNDRFTKVHLDEPVLLTNDTYSILVKYISSKNYVPLNKHYFTDETNTQANVSYAFRLGSWTDTRNISTVGGRYPYKVKVVTHAFTTIENITDEVDSISLNETAIALDVEE